jgi:hypothetical protein
MTDMVPQEREMLAWEEVLFVILEVVLELLELVS